MKTIILLSIFALVGCEKSAPPAPAASSSNSIHDVQIEDITPMANGDAYARGSSFSDHPGLWHLRGGEAVRVKEVEKFSTPAGPIVAGWTAPPKKQDATEEYTVAPGVSIDHD